MKKVLKWVGLVVLVAIILSIVNYFGLLDTRFWFYDRKVYQPFYSGTYVCGVDLEPGSYDVEIRGGSQDTGIVYVKNIAHEDDNRDFWVMTGDKGFHFSVEDGDVVEVSVRTGRDMKIKKAE